MLDSFKSRRTLTVKNMHYDYFSLDAVKSNGIPAVDQLPCTLKILLENLLRNEDGKQVTKEDVLALNDWLKHKKSDREIAWRPARVLMQDFTGVPAVVDLAAMRDALEKLGGNPENINPLSPVDLVIDHSVQADEAGTPTAFATNANLEMQRNQERYRFLRWGQEAFDNFRVVPPDTGICHQVNLEFLAKTVWTETVDGKTIAFPDTLVGTDSHTTMVNGLGVLGWGVGGIEAEAAMLGQPVSMLIPEVVGVKLTGQLREGVTATDLVLTLTHLLRKKGVVSKFVEYFGPGLKDLSLADRATVANMAPEYGATCGFFPVDQATIDYLHLTGRDESLIALVESYAKAQGLWRDDDKPDPIFSDILTLDISTVEPSLAGPKRPQDRVALANVANTFDQLLSESGRAHEKNHAYKTEADYEMHHGDVVIAAITSCTNTSNPAVLMAAGLLARKALAKGLKRKPWVKASLAPGSQVVTRYLNESGLQKDLDSLGFNLVGYGCTTCIGNSGPLAKPIADSVVKNDLTVSAVLSGNRNFEGRIHPLVKANWLASPPLVVAYALAGTTSIDLTREPLGHVNGQPILLSDIWPTNAEITKAMSQVRRQYFTEQYADVFAGTKEWQAMQIPSNKTYTWQADSTYIQHPPFFANMKKQPDKIHNFSGARILALLGDSITTDHISPAGSIKPDSPAGKYLLSHGIAVSDFNSLGARRGNHEVMMRGTFANIRIRNEMVPGIEGGFTRYVPSNEIMPIFDAAMLYQKQHTPLVVIAGKEYGTGSSRDWAAKGPKLLGVVAVIAESFERIHRSNLVGMGILPLEFMDGVTRKTLQLTGDEQINISGLEKKITPRMTLDVTIEYKDGNKAVIPVLCRIDTVNEVEYYQNGGILQFVLRKLLHNNP
ncbi:MAG: aconitate hydratase AcnA [Gammaproteobacteria bacterium]|nr:aconitate hydratase AcnA [Gammaproteobacteria bacterium]